MYVKNFLLLYPFINPSLLVLFEQLDWEMKSINHHFGQFRIRNYNWHNHAHARCKAPNKSRSYLLLRA
jgi:hypothetical protein